MPGGLRIVALVATENDRERLVSELSGAAFELVTDDTAVESADLLIVGGDDWEARARSAGERYPDMPILALVTTPESGEVTAALEGAIVADAVSASFRPGELARACRRAREIATLRREVDAARRRSTRGLEELAVLGEIGARLEQQPSYEAALAWVTAELPRLVPVDVAAAMIAVGDADPMLLLHSHGACDAYLARATRDRCLELFMRYSGRSIDEDLLRVEARGEPLAASGAARPPGATTSVPLCIGKTPVGVLFVSAGDRASFTDDERRSLSLLASRASDALARLSTRKYDEVGRLSLMVESMGDGLIMAELKSDEVLINPAARRLLGIGDDENVTRQYLKHTVGFYPFDLVTAGPGSEAPLREELTIGEKELHSMVSPVRDGAGQVVAVVVVLRDFTEARELARRQTEFVSVVSHELRTPLTSITGALDIALSAYAGRLNDKQRRYLQLARDSCTHLSAIVDDLLDVARSDGGSMPVHFTPLSLVELGQNVIDRHREAAAAKGIHLEVETEERDIRIVGDPERLTQVLNNLLSNAVKFTPTLGTIEVEIFGPSVAANHVGVAVYNNGEPVAEGDRERIFEKFEQVKEDSVRRVGGTGLGLAISRAIIEAHGGRIWVESGDEGQGTRFVFTLPSAPDVSEGPETEAPETETTSAPAAGGLVLLVDPDQYSSYIVKGLLMAAGYEVLVATDADDALGIARTRHPALVVVHDECSLEQSLALVEIFKHDPDTRKTAVLVLSATRDREVALRAGADDFLRMPFEPPAFRHACTRLVAEAGNARASKVLIVDDDRAIRAICREVLSQAGYKCLEAENGLVALSDAKRFKPDLVLLDVMMPNLDGFQTAEHLRTDPASAMTPIIFLSARGETADKVRAFRIGAEDYVVKPFVAAELVARVRKALERRDRELGASPTTQLPGAGAIEAEIERRLGGGDAAFCYLDLDNLKAFNDYYGYAKADGVIRQTGDLVRDIILREGSPGDFIGHIAGDDFVFITSIDRVDRVCATICSAFDRLVPLYYNKADRERGFIEAKDRYGEMRKFPIMSVSLAAVTAPGLRSYAELAASAAAGKKLAKSVVGSSYVRDDETLIGGKQSSSVVA